MRKRFIAMLDSALLLKTTSRGSPISSYATGSGTKNILQRDPDFNAR